MKRRELVAAGLTSVASLIAGCTGGQSDASPTSTPTPTPTAAGDGSPTPTSTGTDVRADVTVTVGPNGNLVFDPATLQVDSGTTVAWSWDSSGHTVTVASQPDGASWEGTGQETKSSGYVLTHTFDVEGRYDYYCVPHRSAGMKGTVYVGVTPTPTGGGTPTPTDSGGGGYY